MLYHLSRLVRRKSWFWPRDYPYDAQKPEWSMNWLQHHANRLRYTRWQWACSYILVHDFRACLTMSWIRRSWLWDTMLTFVLFVVIRNMKRGGMLFPAFLTSQSYVHLRSPLQSSPHLSGWWLPLHMGKKACVLFWPSTSLDFRLLSLDWVREESDTKLLTPWTLFPRFLSVILFLSLFRASGENTGSFARSASSLTKTTKSWKDTVLFVFLKTSCASRHHLEPDLSGNLELISCNIQGEFSSSIYCMDCIAPSEQTRKSAKSWIPALSPSAIWVQHRSLEL